MQQINNLWYQSNHEVTFPNQHAAAGFPEEQAFDDVDYGDRKFHSVDLLIGQK